VRRVADEQPAAMVTVALAWLLTRQGVVAPVVSVRTADQLFDVMSAPDIRLTRHQLAELDRASA
jgi:aryl-alcohol dehydrogenase-like predicted oxidoreductase